MCNEYIFSPGFAFFLGCLFGFVLGWVGCKDAYHAQIKK